MPRIAVVCRHDRCRNRNRGDPIDGHIIGDVYLEALVPGFARGYLKPMLARARPRGGRMAAKAEVAKPTVAKIVVAQPANGYVIRENAWEM